MPRNPAKVKIQVNKQGNRLLHLVTLLLFLVILSACAGAPQEEPAAPAEPAAPEAPAEPVDPGEQLPVTYGQDSRTEVFQHPDPKLQEMAASVAVLVHKDQVKVSGENVTLAGYTLNEMGEMGWLVRDVNAPMCTDELFISQVAPGFCTGFLVKEDVLVTAGHCLEKTPCSETSIVFGFQMASEDSLATLTTEDVFQCTEVIARAVPDQGNQYLDYAILRLDRASGRGSLAYATNDTIQADDHVAVLGYPSGLPLKVASNAIVMSAETDSPFFVTNLDTFGSNSGSPVINTDSYQVEGILVRGATDYILSNDRSCVQVNRCPESGDINCIGENATKLAILADHIPDSKVSKSIGFNCYPNLLLVLVIVCLSQIKTKGL